MVPLFQFLILHSVSGKKRRLTIIECGCDINTMIDLAKVADLVSYWHVISAVVYITFG